MRLKLMFLTAIMGCCILVGCNATSNPMQKERIEERIIYTEDDIYLISFECGYLSQDEKPGIIPLLIENNEQLAFAETRYGLAFPEWKTEEQNWYYDSAIIDAFQYMKSLYPLSEYTYIVEYKETTSGMYYYNVDKLIIDGDKLYFEMDDKSKNGNNYDEVTCDMSGWCYLAAVPKELLKDRIFVNVIYPDAEDVTQDLLYSSQSILDVYDSSLYELYGNQVYVIGSAEEYEEFTAKADELPGGNNPFRNVWALGNNYDYEQVKVVYLFFERDYNGMWFKQNTISIENGVVSVDYEIIKNDGYNALDKTQTCVQRIILPASSFK